MPPSSISKAVRTASRAAASAMERSPSGASLPPQAGHWPYGKAKPSLTFAQASQRHCSFASAQQMYSSSPSMGWRHFGQTFEADSTIGAPFAVTGAAASPATTGVMGTNASMSASVIGHFDLPPDSQVAMPFA